MLYDILDLLIIIAILGLILYLVNRFIPMDPRFKSIMNTIAIVLLVVVIIFWLLSFLGYNPRGRLGARSGMQYPPVSSTGEAMAFTVGQDTVLTFERNQS